MATRSCVAIVVCLMASALEGTGWCANFVYKGVLKAESVTTGEKISASEYVVLAEAGRVNTSDDYVYTGYTTIFVGGVAGKKHFLRATAPEFRTVHLLQIVKGKPRAVTIVSRGVASPSDISSHNFQAEVLTGVKKDPAERMPSKLRGVSMFTSGSGSSTVATGELQLTTSKLSLVRDLTDQVQPGETLDQTVARVVAFLESKGFTELTP
jgi:hypothetical protein